MSDEDSSDEPQDPKAEEPGRRRFMTVMSAVGSAAIGGLLAVPATGYVLDPLLRRKIGSGEWFDIGSVESLRDDAPILLPVIGDLVDSWTRAPAQVLGNVFLQKRGEEVLALTAECPHLGCQIGYDENAEAFGCPCHESEFSMEGEVRGGPSPRGMDELEARVVDGRVEVRFVRYRAQTSDQVPV